MQTTCTHEDAVHEVTPSADGCEDCLKMGTPWVHLRLCMSCGHVGCCDNSPNRHATAHFRSSGHPIMVSFEPGDNWGWCFVDEVDLEEDWPIDGQRYHSRAADMTNMKFAREYWSDKS